MPIGLDALKITLFILGLGLMAKGYFDKAYKNEGYDGIYDAGYKFRVIGFLVLAYPVLDFIGRSLFNLIEMIITKLSQPCS